jgi:hypothetical protein
VAAWTPVYQALGGRYGTVLPGPKNLPEGIKGASVFAPNVAFADREVGEKVWGGYVPEALEKGVFKVGIRPECFGQGLEAVQGALDRAKKGVSYGKIVVEL